MISKKVQTILQSNIDIYDKLCDKQYYICFALDKKNNYAYTEIHIESSAFWHLLGCKTMQKIKNEIAFQKCLNKENIQDLLKQVHTEEEINKKAKTFTQIFNFVDNAKKISVGYPNDTSYDICFCCGDNSGIIGYSKYTEKARFLFPKSCKSTPILLATQRFYKIMFILSKPINKKRYTKLEYEISPGVFDNIKNNYLTDLKNKVNIK